MSKRMNEAALSQAWPSVSGRDVVREALGRPTMGDTRFMPQLIALVGGKGCGKDTAAGVLLREYGFKKIAFADPIKDMCLALGLTDAQVHDPEEKEQPVDWLGQATPRYVMQTLGTEWGRRMVDPDLWVNAVERRILRAWQNVDEPTYFVLTDVRFPNEIEMARDLGALVIHIRRGRQSWWQRLKARFAHQSERPLPVLPGDTVLRNDGTVEDLHEKVVAACYGRLEGAKSG